MCWDSTGLIASLTKRPVGSQSDDRCPVLKTLSLYILPQLREEQTHTVVV